MVQDTKFFTVTQNGDAQEGTSLEGGFASVTLHDPEPLTVNNVLFGCRHGSHLYGTSVEGSDDDFKFVFVEDYHHLVFDTRRTTINLSTGQAESKNTSVDADFEFIELDKFLHDLIAGQTYAVEMLYANEENTIISTPVWQQLVASNTEKPLIEGDVKPFMGYCLAHVRKYADRINNFNKVKEVYEALCELPPKARVHEIVDQVPKNEIVRVFSKNVGTDDDPNEQKMIEIHDKQFNFQVRVDYMLPSLKRVVDQYGKRVKKGAGDGVDWKSIYHTYRCIFELGELLTTGELTFPLAKRDFLLTIRHGKVPYDQVVKELPELIDDVKQINSVLPAHCDRDFWHRWMLSVYKRAHKGV